MSLLGLPAYAVELRYASRDPKTGKPVEHIQLHKPYVERALADDEYNRLFDQLCAGNGDGRWRIVLTGADDAILREFTR